MVLFHEDLLTEGLLKHPTDLRSGILEDRLEIFKVLEAAHLYRTRQVAPAQGIMTDYGYGQAPGLRGCETAHKYREIEG